MTPLRPRLDRAWFQRLKLDCDDPVSTSAFKFNLRRYIKVFDILQMERVECSINLSPFPTKLLSGTVIPTGVYFLMKNVDILFLFKFDVLLLNIDLFSLVGRCRLTVSKPVLKAPMVSALDATI